MKTLMKVDEVATLIKAGKRLLLAGDEALLQQLPQGEWVGGTIPYFMGENGGQETSELIQVGELPSFVEGCKVKTYSPIELVNIPKDYQPNGVSFIMIPAFSEAHAEFANYCFSYPGIFNRPLLGWVTGYHLGNSKTAKAKVFNGFTKESYSDRAIVLHLNLADHKYGKVNIINLFKPGSGDTIIFKETGFGVKTCWVNGVERNFYEYVKLKSIDTQLPLVANYLGAMVNVSIMSLNDDSGTVDFYAPVFQGVEYKFASPVEDYAVEFEKHVKASKLLKPTFSCNCILNYLYAKLEGKKTANIMGPMTFGEIAYMLLNQTMVYITFEDK